MDQPGIYIIVAGKDFCQYGNVQLNDPKRNERGFYAQPQPHEKLNWYAKGDYLSHQALSPQSRRQRKKTEEGVSVPTRYSGEI